MLSAPWWLQGMVAGVAVWLVAFLSCLVLESFEAFVPDWLGPLALVSGILAMPVMLGGWLFWWGDDGPPFPWLNGVWINVVAGITLCGCLGVVVAKLLGRLRNRRRRVVE